MALSAAEQKEVDRVNEAEYQKSLKSKALADAPKKAGADGAGTPITAVDVKIEKYESKQPAKAPKEHEEVKAEKKDAKKETPVVSSVAQLRDESIRQNLPVSQEQLEEVRALEVENEKEGGKKHRLPSAEADSK